ncbi:uncharacterized protein LOC127102800 [Lathyrus oleraceus]|uniref:uncharacterized protein LOC127102800 n=1 Tax=Pisum sativum TaxID=3888 RepID=UPI0021D3CFD9|nr:uncharacterized protein LOC127102800 [Pisum sativum]
MEILKKLHINIPVIKVIQQMPNCSKFMKDVLTKRKRVREFANMALTQDCSQFVQGKLPPKLKDPGTFIIPCNIGDSYVIGNYLILEKVIKSNDELEKELGEKDKDELIRECIISVPLLLIDGRMEHFETLEIKAESVKHNVPSTKSPPKLELKQLPSHLQYSYLEAEHKLLVIIATDLSDNKGVGNLVTDHLSILPDEVERRDKEGIKEEFFDEEDSKNYYRGEIVMYKMCVDPLLKRCVDYPEARQILSACHNVPFGGFEEPKLLLRYGTPKVIISDEGAHFCNKRFEVLMNKYGFKHKVSTTYHPQSSGQPELSNREIKIIIEKVVNPSRKNWSKYQDDVSWA